MTAQLERQLAPGRQRHEISGQIKSLKSIAPLEVAERILQPVCVHQVWYAFLRAAFDDFRQQRVRWRQIAVGNLGNNLAKAGISPGVPYHDETDQFVAEICAKDFLPVQEPAEFAFDRLKVLAVMQKTPSLTHRRFIKDGCYSLHKCIVKLCHPNDDTMFLRFPDLVSHLAINLFLPPKGVVLDRESGDGIAFHGIGIPRLGLREALPKSQKIGAILA